MGNGTAPSTEALSGAILKKLREAMAVKELNVILAMSPENIVYVAGVVPPSLRTVRSRLACAVIPAQGSTELIIVALEKGAVESASASRQDHYVSRVRAGPRGRVRSVTTRKGP